MRTSSRPEVTLPGVRRIVADRASSILREQTMFAQVSLRTYRHDGFDFVLLHW